MPFDKLEFDDLDYNISKLEVLEENDLVPSTEKRTADPNLINYSPLDTALIGAGEASTRAARGIKDLGLATGEFGSQALGNLGLDSYKAQAKKYTDKRNELAELIRQERELFNQNIGSDQNPNQAWAKGGQLSADIGMGYALPFLRGKTILQTIGKNAPLAGAYETITNPGSFGERAKQGVLGIIGSGLGIGALGTLGKGYEYLAPRAANSFENLADPIKQFVGDNTLRPPRMESSWKDADAIAKQQLADSIGSPVSIGDINEGGILRMVEQGFANENQRGGVLKHQVSALEDAIGVVKNNMSKAVEDTSKKLTSVGNDIFAPVQQKIGKTSILIDPATMHAEARNVRDNFAPLLEPNFYDKSKIVEFNTWIDNPYPLTYNEFRNFQQILGKAKGRAKDLVDKGEIEKGALTAANTAYAKSYDDFKAWGQTGSPRTRKKYAEIVDEHGRAMKEWERDVLPFDNDVSSALKQANTPEETVSVLLNPKNKSTLEKVVAPELNKHSPEGKHLYDAVRLLNRAGENMSTGILPPTAHPSDILNPLLTGVRKGVSSLTSTKGAKDLYYGEFDHLLPTRETQFVPRKGSVLSDLKDASVNAVNRLPIGYAREQEDFSEAMLNAFLMSLFSKDKSEKVSPGAISEVGASAGTSHERK